MRVPTRTNLLTMAALLAGCATGPAPPEPAPLTCDSTEQCALYWQRAQLWIARNSRVRIATATDVIIETFPGEKYHAYLVYRATREPMNDGRFTVRLYTACGNPFGCSLSRAEAVASFNSYMQTGQ